MKKILSIVLVVLISSCGGGVRGEPPLVSVSRLTLDAPGMVVRVDIHNPNDDEMQLASFSITMTVNEALLPQSRRPTDLIIHPHGTEEIEISLRPDDGTRKALTELESGGRRGLPYSVEGEVRDNKGSSERFEHSGYFYPVPGRPGQFRGAGPQR